MAVLNFPQTSNYTPGVLAHCFNTLRRAFIPVVTTEEAVEHVLLRAPDGSVWRVRVGADGALATTRV